MILTVAIIAIGLSLLAGILWISPFDIPGPFDEILVTISALLAWAWFCVLLWGKTQELLQNETFVISLIAVTVIIISLAMIRSYIRRRK